MSSEPSYDIAQVFSSLHEASATKCGQFVQWRLRLRQGLESRLIVKQSIPAHRTTASSPAGLVFYLGVSVKITLDIDIIFIGLGS